MDGTVRLQTHEQVGSQTICRLFLGTQMHAKNQTGTAEPGEFEKITSIDRTAVVHFSPPATDWMALRMRG